MSLPKRIVVLPDIHCPNYDERAIDPVLQFIKFFKPEVLVQLGDFCDWDSVSTYDPRQETDIQPIDHEIESANQLLDDIDKITKNCKKIMLGGNHEARYEQFRVNQGMLVGIRRMKSLTSWQEEYNLSKRGWESHDYGKHIQIGKIVMTHGWFTGNNAAQRMAACFPGRNVLFGHTHQHLIHTALDEHDLPIQSESIGTLSRFDLSYLKGKPPLNWIHSFCYIDMLENGQFSKHIVNIIDGHFIELGRLFQDTVV